MAFASNTPVVVTPETDFLVQPAADRDPLYTILKNANGMFESFAPAHLSALYTVEKGISARSAVFEIPILPSADGLDYDFSHWIYAEAGGAGTLTVQVEEWTGAAWNTIENTAGIAAAAATMVRHDHTAAVDANATKLRITISRVTDAFTPVSILMRPGTNTITTGVKASGFVPFDDGLLNVGTNDAGINTEHLNRGPQNAMAILKDRRQCVFSFVQESGIVNPLYFAEDSPLSAGLFARFGEAMASIPNQRDPQVKVLAIGSVDGGATADLINVYQVGGKGVTLDADGNVQSADLDLKLLDPGGLHARAKMGCAGAYVALQSMALNAVVVLWRPGD